MIKKVLFLFFCTMVAELQCAAAAPRPALQEQPLVIITDPSTRELLLRKLYDKYAAYQLEREMVLLESKRVEFAKKRRAIQAQQQKQSRKKGDLSPLRKEAFSAVQPQGHEKDEKMQKTALAADQQKKKIATSSAIKKPAFPKEEATIAPHLLIRQAFSTLDTAGYRKVGMALLDYQETRELSLPRDLLIELTQNDERLNLEKILEEDQAYKQELLDQQALLMLQREEEARREWEDLQREIENARVDPTLDDAREL